MLLILASILSPYIFNRAHSQCGQDPTNRRDHLKSCFSFSHRNRLWFLTAQEDREGIWGCTARTPTLLLVENIRIFSLHMAISPPFCVCSIELKSTLNQKAKTHKWLCSWIIKKWISKHDLNNKPPEQELKRTTWIYLKRLRRNTNMVVQSLRILCLFCHQKIERYNLPRHIIWRTLQFVKKNEKLLLLGNYLV